MNIILTGYRCTGKTSIGRLLAGIGGYPFFDVDELVCRRNSKTIAEIIADGGWPAFRKVESSVIEELSCLNGVVIATGGGALLDPSNVEHLKRNGVFIWLVASVETISERIKNDTDTDTNRPSLSGQDPVGEVSETLKQRQFLYRQCADMTVMTENTTPMEAAELIYRRLTADNFRTAQTGSAEKFTSGLLQRKVS